MPSNLGPGYVFLQASLAFNKLEDCQHHPAYFCEGYGETKANFIFCHICRSLLTPCATGRAFLDLGTSSGTVEQFPTGLVPPDIFQRTPKGFVAESPLETHSASQHSSADQVLSGDLLSGRPPRIQARNKAWVRQRCNPWARRLRHAWHLNVSISIPICVHL